MPATTVVLFGATGDLAKRKLLPGMLHLHESQLLEGLRVVATSLDELSRDEFLDLVFASIREHSSHAVTDDDLREFADRIHWVPGSAGPQGIRAAVGESRRPSSVTVWLECSRMEAKTRSRNSSRLSSSSDVATTRRPESSCDSCRCSMPGSSLRLARSPVAPNRTTVVAGMGPEWRRSGSGGRYVIAELLCWAWMRS